MLVESSSLISNISYTKQSKSIALLEDRELFVEILRDSRVLTLIMFANGERQIFVFSHALV